MNKILSNEATSNTSYAVALARAFAGALIFCVPLLMTMEMWTLGTQLKSWLLIQFSLANLALLFGLSKIAGFEESHSLLDDVLDVFAAYFVATVTAALVLFLIGMIRVGMPAGDVAGRIAIQAVPASFGAMIGAKLLGAGEEIERKEHWRESYTGQMFLLFAGALFLSLTVAPTEEALLIGIAMEPWHALALMAISILILHAILYFVGFAGQDRRLKHGHLTAFLRHSIPGYALAVAASVYMLWTFGHLDNLDSTIAARSVVTLAFPSAIGAGLARVVI